MEYLAKNYYIQQAKTLENLQIKKDIEVYKNVFLI